MSSNGGSASKQIEILRGRESKYKKEIHELRSFRNAISWAVCGKSISGGDQAEFDSNEIIRLVQKAVNGDRDGMCNYSRIGEALGDDDSLEPGTAESVNSIIRQIRQLRNESRQLRAELRLRKSAQLDTQRMHRRLERRLRQVGFNNGAQSGDSASSAETLIESLVYEFRQLNLQLEKSLRSETQMKSRISRLEEQNERLVQQNKTYRAAESERQFVLQRLRLLGVSVDDSLEYSQQREQISYAFSKFANNARIVEELKSALSLSREDSNPKEV